MTDDIHRRLTTIVAADVAGYSRLIRADEEATVQAMRSHRRDLIDPLIEHHGGRIANTAGDSLLVEFDSAVEAVRCAVAMQSGMAERNADIPSERQVNFRMGINVGDVVAEGGDLLGDGVNVAARLEAMAEPGGICMSRSVREQVRDHLGLDLVDMGEVKVKNIDRPVRVFKILVEGAAGGSRTGGAGRMRGPFLALAVIFLLSIAGAVGWWWSLRPDLVPADQNKFVYELPAKPSIAVLPFENLSGDPEQQFLALGFSEDILTSLSKLSGMFVISGSTTSKFAGNEYSAGRVAENLGVRFVLKGNLQRDDDRIRVSAQLIDAIDGRFIWSERYDGEMTDLFAVKDEITLKIIANVGAKLELGDSDKLRSRETNNLDAWLLQREGWRAIQKLNAQDNAVGRGLLERAVELDPAFVTAYANLATSYRFDYQMRWVEDREAANEKAYEFHRAALAIDPDHGLATAAFASWYLVNGDLRRAVETASRAVTLEPNDYFVHAFYGMALVHTGDADKAVEELELSLRLSPRGPDWVVFKLAEAYLVQGDPGAAARVARELLDRPPSSSSNKNIAHINHALALHAMGRVEEARREIELAVDAFPKRTLAVWEQQRPYADEELQRAWSSTLRELGMP